MSKSVTILGGGKMGCIIASSLLLNGQDFDIKVIEKNVSMHDKLKNELKLEVYQSLSENNSADIYVLAVKPQDFKELLDELTSYLDSDSGKKLVISIAAGITEDYISKHLSKHLDHIEVLRVMPNTASKLGCGLTALPLHASVSSENLDIAVKIFRNMGQIVYTDDFDTATALSGSGPAYFFNLADVMREYAVDKGMNPDQATVIAAYTVLGAARMMEHGLSGTKTFRELKEEVTSPGGTTAAALGYMNENDFEKIFYEAIERARMRSIELSRGDE